jgi:fructan beta-fructosidase
LKEWTLASEFGENNGAKGLPWECPDLFELPVDGNAKNKKWVMLVSLGDGAPNGGSGTEYFVGSFDGKIFKNDNASEVTQWVDYGRDNYAGVTWSNVPSEDGRRIFLAWMSNWKYAQNVPTAPWRSAMTVPRVLNLKTTENGVKLVSNPIKEIQILRGALDIAMAAQTIKGETKPKTALAKVVNKGEMVLEFDKKTASDFGIKLANSKGEMLLIGFDNATNQFYIDRTNAGKNDFSDNFKGKHFAPRFSKLNTVKLHIIFDRSSVEVFADDGLTVMTDIFFPNEDFNILTFYANVGEVKLKSGRGYPFKGIWKK